MQQHPWRDVVLLNSDTIVVNNWLDRLQALAYSDKEIATVTPLSNYAEKFSYPSPFKGNDLPLVKEIKNIDKIAAQVNKTEKIEVPTGNGFCFFIKRDCLNQIGYFNQTDLLRGYSEESEFCLRASEKGWKHLCATNVYVGHEGGQSFKQERARLVYLNNEQIKKKYPLYSESVYRFIADDPLKKARKKIERAALKFKKCDEFHVVDYYIRNHPLFKEQLKLAVFMGKSVWVLTIAYKSFETYFQLYSVTQGLSNLEYACLTGFNELVKDLKKLKLKQINVHYSYYFPSSLNKIITQLKVPIRICPYDNGLQKKVSEILWIKYIHNIGCISDYSASQYNDYPNYKIIKFPDNFYKSFYKKNYLSHIAIFGDITNHQQVQLLRLIVEDWEINNLPLNFVIVGDSNFKYGLESRQRIIFTSLNIEKSRELKNICSHVFILPNSSDFIPIDLSLALQHGFQVIAVAEPNIQEILSLQPTAITIEDSDEAIAAIKKTFQNYAKKLS
jgi:GT2 family glycosyltransferase